FEGLSEEGWGRVTASDPWTVRDTLAHLVGGEVSQQGLIRRWLEGHTQLDPRFDLDYWNRRQLEKRKGRTPEQLLADLKAARQTTLQMLNELDEAALDTPGEHPFFGETTVEGVFKAVYRHDRMHSTEIREALGR
ncbi:MAG: DinB family protein, partial [Anaerolineae bacterium]